MNPQDSLPEITAMQQKLAESSVPAPLRAQATTQIDRITLTLKYGGNMAQLDITNKYIDWITSLPWDKKSDEVLDIKRAKEILDANHFGLDKIKTRILEYLSILILQRQKLELQAHHAPSLFFVGLAGTGKTTLARSIALALGRTYVRIPFGGLSSALDLRGQSKTSPEAEPGMILKGIRRAGVKNPVILLDELDRITPESRAAVMGVLVELLDPGQNMNFTDYFIDYPFDLSQVLFIATANNTNNIATAVMDRLEAIDMPSYNDDEKITIGKKYILPRYLKEVGIEDKDLTIDEALWPKLVRPLGFDSGMRSLERTVEGIVRKAAHKIVKGEGKTFALTEENVKEFV